jgi:hypothetical protein
MADNMENRDDTLDSSEAARTLGKLGASKGGKARARALRNYLNSVMRP